MILHTNNPFLRGNGKLSYMQGISLGNQSKDSSPWLGWLQDQTKIWMLPKTLNLVSLTCTPSLKKDVPETHLHVVLSASHKRELKAERRCSNGVAKNECQNPTFPTCVCPSCFLETGVWLDAILPRVSLALGVNRNYNAILKALKLSLRNAVI